MEIENKSKIQEQAIQAWKEVHKKGTIVVGTGVGKTRIGLMAIEKSLQDYLNNPNLVDNFFSALIVVPTTNLRDNEWVNEIEKWFPHLKQYIKIDCIQSAYKNNYDVNILILDEVHTCLPIEYRKVFNSKYEDILGLTATTPHIEEYLEFLEEKIPICFKLNMQESVDLGLISDYEIFNIPIHFTKKEKGKYLAYSKMFKGATIKLSGYNLNPFDAASEIRLNKSHPLFKIAQQFWTGMSLRRWTCYKAENKLQGCLDIILNVERKKWIIFCQHTEFADKLAELLRDKGILAISYHSKLKLKDKKAVLEAANSSLCKVICSAQALNTGYNLPNIDGAISIASSSTELTFIQQLGRSTRLQENKKAIFINLYVKDTQEEEWIQKKMINSKSININLIDF